MYLRQVGAGTVMIKDKSLLQKGSRFKFQYFRPKGPKKLGMVIAAKTPLGSGMAGTAPGVSGIVLQPVLRKILGLLLVNSWTVKWFFKLLFNSNKNRQK